ncbi:hypothetical protein L6R53_28125 [Myxococcota bacterium]|nr:hypothetical protein [Myxococcota bacterium]
MRLRFTFLTLGGGSERTLDSADEKGGEDAAGVVYLSEDLGFDDLLSGSGSALHPNPPRMRSVLRQYWSRDHFDPTFLALAEENPTARRNLRYHLCSLDLSVSFKRVAVRAMARACANLLLQAEAAVKAGQPLSPDGSPLSESDRAAFSLAGVLEGIELFNEADVRCVATPESGADDVVETARIWALGWVSAALGFLDGFAAAGVELPERCLFLPGLASVAASDPVGPSPKAPALTWSPLCWPWKRVFLQTLAEHIDRVWSLLRGEGGLGGGIPTPVLDLPPLDDVVGGVDLHWYHFELRAEVAVGTEKAEVGPLHAAWLMTEVAEVVGILEDLGLDGKVTVTESSASGQRGKGYQVAPGRAPGDVTEEEAEAFQAGEVWRRLLAATAGGASVAGWMPWCELSGDYGGNGLRRKPDERDALAQSTTARPAYFAFHRAALLLRGAETVRLRWPETLPARSAMILPRRGDPNAGLSPVLVFELRTPAVDRIGPTDTREMAWAYVLMVDPTAPDTTAHRVELQSATGSLGGVLRLEPWAGDVEAWAQKNPYGEEVIDGDPELEARRKTWLVQYDLVGSIPALLFPFPGATTASAVEVSRGEPPLVFLSPEAIDFSLTPG